MPFTGTGVVLVDLNGRIAFASTYFCDLVGVEHDKIAGTSYFDFFFPEDLEEAKKKFETGKSPNPPPFRFRLKRSDGSAVWANIQKTPLRRDTGMIYAVSATVTKTEPPASQGPG